MKQKAENEKGTVSGSDAVEKISPVGAYNDKPVRAMSESIDNSAAEYTKSSCSDACKNYKYFGLQDQQSNGKSQCFCSNDLDKTTQYGEDSCGEGGGPWCNYVYKTNINGDVSESVLKDIDILDENMNNLLTMYLKEVVSTETVNTNSTHKETMNFYVANFSDSSYYTKAHVKPIGPFTDRAQRAMTTTISDGNWLYDEASCSQTCKDFTYFGLQDKNSETQLSQCFCENDFDKVKQYGESDCGPGGGPWCNYVYEHVKPPPIPDDLHLGKMYFGEKKLGDSTYTVYEYPASKIDYTGRSSGTKIEFFEIDNFDSYGNDTVSKKFDTLDLAKEYCVEIGSVGFVYQKSTGEYYFKNKIFPQSKKTANTDCTIHLVVPSVNTATICNKKVMVVSPDFINSNCILSTAESKNQYYIAGDTMIGCTNADRIKTADECKSAGSLTKNGYNKEVSATNRAPGCFSDPNGYAYFNNNNLNTDDTSSPWGTGICKHTIPFPISSCEKVQPYQSNISNQLVTIGTTMANQMQEIMQNKQKYLDQQPIKRKQYQQTLENYAKAMKTIKKRETDIHTENKISSDAMQNVKMHQSFMYFVLAIIALVITIGIVGFSWKILLIAVILIMVFLYIMIGRNKY